MASCERTSETVGRARPEREIKEGLCFMLRKYNIRHIGVGSTAGVGVGYEVKNSERFWCRFVVTK